MAIGLPLLAVYFAFEKRLFPPPIDLTIEAATVTYAFKDANYAEKFAELNVRGSDEQRATSPESRSAWKGPWTQPPVPPSAGRS